MKGKHMKTTKIIRNLIASALLAALLLLGGISAGAEEISDTDEVYGEVTEVIEAETPTEDGGNVFAEIYEAASARTDGS